MTGLLSGLFGSAQQLHQYAALPYRLIEGGKIEVALITSRGTGRWIIPKGWPEPDATPSQLAAREALEEAGLTGEVTTEAIGFYTYRKQLHLLASVICRVDVFALRVTSEHGNWRERLERERGWFSPAEAARQVAEKELAKLLRNFSAPTS